MITPAGWKQQWSVCGMHIRMFRTCLEIAHHKSRVLMNQWRTIWGKEWSGYGRYQRCVASIATGVNASVCRSGRVSAWQICTVGRWGFGHRSSIISRGLWKSWHLCAEVEVHCPWDPSSLASITPSLGQLRNLYKHFPPQFFVSGYIPPRDEQRVATVISWFCIVRWLPPAAPCEQFLLPSRFLRPAALVPEGLLDLPSDEVTASFQNQSWTVHPSIYASVRQSA